MDPLLGTASIGAAFFAGILALLAPCCITFLLPSYLAAGIQQGRFALLRMTLVFSAGIAVVLLPIAWGVAGLGQLIPTLHRELFFVGGTLLLVLAFLSLTGRSWSIPLPWAPDLREKSVGSVFALGAFSGTASSCCAPVLAGVLALGLVAPTWWLGLGVGVAYVFGMVFPLLLVAVFGQRLNVLEHPALRPRPLTLRLGPWRPRVLSTNLASGVLLGAMGLLVLWVGATGQTAFTLQVLQDAYLALRGVFDAITDRAGAYGPLIVLAAAALVVLLALRGQRATASTPRTSAQRHERDATTARATPRVGERPTE